MRERATEEGGSTLESRPGLPGCDFSDMRGISRARMVRGLAAGSGWYPVQMQVGILGLGCVRARQSERGLDWGPRRKPQAGKASGFREGAQIPCQAGAGSAARGAPGRQNVHPAKLVPTRQSSSGSTHRGRSRPANAPRATNCRLPVDDDDSDFLKIQRLSGRTVNGKTVTCDLWRENLLCKVTIAC